MTVGMSGGDPVGLFHSTQCVIEALYHSADNSAGCGMCTASPLAQGDAKIGEWAILENLFIDVSQLAVLIGAERLPFLFA
jgi:hypothetical protein